MNYGNSSNRFCRLHHRDPRAEGRVPDRACLTGILFVLRSGIPWQMLPRELGCGSGMTCWRRLRDWHLAGIWDRIHFALLDWLAPGGWIDWSRAIVDSCSVRAVCGGPKTGPNPTDRAKRGSKRHLICDGGPTTRRQADWSEPQRFKKDSLWSTRFRRFKVNVEDRGVGPIASWAIAVTMPQRSEADCARVAFYRCWPCAAPRTGAAWDAGVGLWNARSPGLISFDDSASATTNAPTSTKRFSHWAVR
jgi:transposase